MGLRFLKIAVVYLFIGAVLGLIMGITQKFVLAPVHAHLLLLGWASLALAGIIYHLYPAAAITALAHIHFWVHNLGLPVFMVGLGMLLTGHRIRGRRRCWLGKRRPAWPGCCLPRTCSST